jgi:hypothetical protein
VALIPGRGGAFEIRLGGALQQPSKVFYYHSDGELDQMPVNPATIGICRSTQAVPMPGAFTRLVRGSENVMTALDTQAIS